MRPPGAGNLYLIGGMGSGKSTVGSALARRLGWDFVDTDRRIERDAGRTIAALFKRRGEKAFRRLERETIAAEAQGSRRVISVGGGAVTEPKTVELMRRTGWIVYLEVSAAAALRRVEAEGIAKRPLFAGVAPAARLAFLRGLLSRRRPLYEACADLRVRCAGAGAGRIAQRIEGRLDFL